jgi:hypothetical protein
MNKEFTGYVKSDYQGNQMIRERITILEIINCPCRVSMAKRFRLPDAPLYLLIRFLTLNFF